MKDFETGRKIKELRLSSGISQDELAEMTQLSLRTIQRIENSETEARGDSLKKISKALEVTVGELTGMAQRGPLQPKLKADKGILLVLHLSVLTFLIFPLLGIVLPLVLWLMYKDKITLINEDGRKIIRSQIYWLSVFFLIYLYIFSSKIFHISLPLPIEPKLILIGLYLYNLIIVLFNIISCFKHKEKAYKPLIGF